MRALVAAMPFAGHVLPMVAVAAELAARGHDVVAHTGRRYGQRFAEVGATWLPWQQAPDFDESDLPATFPQVTNGRGPRAVLGNLEHVFLRTGDGQARDILAAGRFDLLVSDHLAIGSALAAERTGTPWATVGLAPLGLPSRDLPPFGLGLLPGRGASGRIRGRRFAEDVVARARSAPGPGGGAGPELARLPATSVPALEAFYSPHLVLAHGVPDLDYPRSDLPPHVHFVGQLAPTPAGRPMPSWWPELSDGDRAVVHVTQGTYDVDPGDLLLPALTGLASADVLVAAATGGWDLPAARVPDNARLAPFLPHDQLLPRTSVMVTNGGWGGVLTALAAGVPLVVAGATPDKPEVARRVAASGAGIDLRTGRPSPGTVRAAVDEVLTEPRYRQRARAVSESMARHGGVMGAVDLLDRLAAGSPVRRTGDPWSRLGA